MMRIFRAMGLSLLLGIAPAVAQDSSAPAIPTPDELVELLLDEARNDSHQSQEYRAISSAFYRLGGAGDLPLLRPALQRAEILAFNGSDPQTVFDRGDSVALEYFLAGDIIEADRIASRLMAFVDLLDNDQLHELEEEGAEAFRFLALWNTELGHVDRAAEYYLAFDGLMRDDPSQFTDYRDRINAATYLAGLGIVAPSQRLLANIGDALEANTNSWRRDELVEIERIVRLRIAAAADPQSGVAAALEASRQRPVDSTPLPFIEIRQNLLVDLAYDAYFRNDLTSLDLLVAELEGLLLTPPTDLDETTEMSGPVQLFQTIGNCRALDAVLTYTGRVRALELIENAEAEDTEKVRLSDPKRQETVDDAMAEDTIVLVHTHRPPVEISIIEASRGCDDPQLIMAAIHSLIAEQETLSPNRVVSIYAMVGPERIDAPIASLMLAALDGGAVGETIDAANSEIPLEDLLARAMLFRTLGRETLSRDYLQAAWAHIQTLAPGSRSEELALLAFALTV